MPDSPDRLRARVAWIAQQAHNRLAEWRAGVMTTGTNVGGAEAEFLTCLVS